MLRIFLCIVAFAIGLALLVWASTSAPAYEECKTTYHKYYTNPESPQSDQMPERTFIEKSSVFFACEAELIDSYNGVVTAAATFIIACFTATLWFTTWAQLRHNRHTERAFLAGGGPVVKGAGGKRRFRVEVANYGKTAAYLVAFDVRFDTLAGVQDAKPKKVTQRWPYDDWIAPGGVATKKEIGRPIPIPDGTNVIYGVFWYRDIWRKKHLIRFILRIADDDGDTRPDVTRVHKRYREWT